MGSAICFSSNDDEASKKRRTESYDLLTISQSDEGGKS